jgi:hypothetical protein
VPAVPPAPAHILDLARSDCGRGELTQNAACRRRGLRRARGEDAGESARNDGQRNNSSHYDSFLLVGASVSSQILGQPKHVLLIFSA